MARSSKPETSRKIPLFPESDSRRRVADGDPAERFIWMLLALVRKREFSPAAYHDRFGGSSKTLGRDLARLRRLGARYGFAIVRPRGRAVGATHIDGVPNVSPFAPDVARDVLAAIADALGEVVSESLAGYVDVSQRGGDGFLRVAMPRLIEQTQVAATYRELRKAWTRNARVRFVYAKPGARAEEREVEPYFVTYYSGRYYLVGYDIKPGGGWRQFALDRIAGSAALAGTMQRRRPIPEPYRGEDAIGLFKDETPGSRMTIWLSPAIAEAVAAREWKRGQEVRVAKNGSALISFDVFDIDEGVRWALGFGAEAMVIAPQSAVDRAGALLDRMLAAYETRSARTA